MSSPSCGGEVRARLIAKLLGQALPFGEIRAHIRVKPEIKATTRCRLRIVNAASGNPNEDAAIMP
jgi:hypothetical protein